MVKLRWVARFNALKLYFFRALFNSRTNAPYVSGDGIASLCEISMNSPMRRIHAPSIEEIRTASSIFVPGHKLDEFLYNYSDLVTAKVLVVGNSDRDYFSMDFNVPRSVSLLLLQNSHVSGNSVMTLPIGVENLRYGKNGRQKYFKYTGTPKNGKILVGPYSNTHSERTEIKLLSEEPHPRITFMDTYVSSRELSKISDHYSYIACPRGNGTDTHRFWETLYRGSIPIVKKSLWSASLRKYEIPFIEVDSWQVEEVIEKVQSFSGPNPFNPKQLDALWLSYWDELIKLYSN